MFKLFKKLKLVIMRGVLFSAICLSCSIANARDYDDLCILPPKGIIAYSGSYIGDATSIMGGNCNPYTNPDEDILPNLDGSLKMPYQKSCEGQGIDINNYKITVQYVRSEPELAVMIASSFVPMAGLFGGPPWNAIVPFELSAIGGTAQVFLANLAPMTFKVELDGDKACVYVDMPFQFGNETKCGVVVNGSVANENDKQNVQGPSGGPDTDGLVNPIDSSLPIHCVPLPKRPPHVMALNWGGFFPPVCTNYDSSASKFKYPNGENRAFTGVVVDCILSTMNNIFTDTTIFAGQTLYQKTQEGLQTLLRYLLVLYVIMFGLPFVYTKKSISQEMWYWFGLRFAMVWFFALGTGMSQLLPYLQITSNTMAMVVLEAASGITVNATIANTNVTAALDTLKIESSALVAARRALAADPGNLAKQAALTAAQVARNNALIFYNSQKVQAASYGYRYCDFRGLVEGDPAAAYTVGKEYMRLWDMIDCKISKFLGVGDNLRATKSPHLITSALAVAVSAIGVGFLILILCIAVTVFFLLVVIRVVSIYIMSTIGLILLVYISPLIIPTALFNYTRYIFKSWLSQVVAYVVQPVILFGFLGFMFAAFDMAMFGGNHNFVPMSHPMGKYDNKICMSFKNTSTPSHQALCTNANYITALETNNVSLDKLKCDDESALGCILQKITIRKDKANHEGLGVNTYNSVIGVNDVNNMFNGLLQMFIISMLAYAVFGLVEEMSVTLTNALGGGGARLSGAPSANPVAIAGRVGSAVAAPVVAGAGKVGALMAKKKIVREVARREYKQKDDSAKKKR